MEVVGAAATVTSTIAFAGQAFNGVVILRRYIQAIKHAPDAAIDVLANISHLENTLQGVADLLERHKDIFSEDPELETELRSLEGNIHRCSTEIRVWLDDDALRSSHGKLSNALLHRLKHGGYMETFETLVKKLAVQLEVLCLDLTYLGRCYDKLAAERCAQFQQKLQQLETDLDSMSHKLSSVESSSSSMTSSFSSSTSRCGRQISNSSKNGLPLRQNSSPASERGGSATQSEDSSLVKFHWSCDALYGIDDSFEHHGADGYSTCMFCDFKFHWIDDECFSRQGRHLVRRHAFGCCSEGKAFSDPKDFLEHLAHHHKLILRNSFDAMLTGFENSWVDLLFRRKGNTRYPQDDTSLELNSSPKQVSNSLPGSLMYLAEISQVAKLVPEVQFNIPKAELTGHPWHQPACIRDLCAGLAKLDDDCTAACMKRDTYYKLCYTTACLEEELTVWGFEDLLFLQTYYSSSHKAVSHFISTNTLQRKVHRVNTGWELYVAAKAPVVATLGEALLHHNIELETEPDAMNAMVETLHADFMRSSNSYLLRGSDGSNVLTSLKLAAMPDDECRVGSRAGKLLSEKIDIWLLGIFVHSLPLRRLLISGKVVPELASTTPSSWWKSILIHWEDHVQPPEEYRPFSIQNSAYLSDGATFGE